MVERFDGRLAGDVPGIGVDARRALDQFRRGFSTVCNARRHRVLDGKTPSQVVTNHRKAEPELANPSLDGRKDSGDIPKPVSSPKLPRRSHSQTSESCNREVFLHIRQTRRFRTLRLVPGTDAPQHRAQYRTYTRLHVAPYVSAQLAQVA